MTEFEREARIRWLTNPPEGVPRMTVGGGALQSVPLNVDLQASDPLATSPGELIAGAIGATFAWLAARELVREGAHAREFTVVVTLMVSSDDDGARDPGLSGIACRLTGRVPNIDQERLEAVAKLSMSRCIETLGLRREGLAMTVEAVLEGH